MSKDNLSRRDFLKAAAALAASGTLVWVSDEIGLEDDVYAALEAIPEQDRAIVLEPEMETEQPFAPYYLDSDSGMWVALLPAPQGYWDGDELKWTDEPG